MRSVVRVAVVLAVCAAACVRMSTIMQSWVGATDADVVSQWGAPDRSIRLADSSRVLTWDRHGCTQSLTVNRTGRIVGWSTTGCPKYLYR